MNNKQNEIKNQVKQHYGKRARQASKLTTLQPLEALRCADGTTKTDMDISLGASPNIYVCDDLLGVPSEAIASSAGCGNPIAFADLKMGERVLDLGSGGGLDCFLAARKVGPTGHVTGLDMTLDMLELARNNAEKLNIVNVEFLEGFIEAIPLPDRIVDVVISNCVICLSPDKDAVIRESFRVLTSRGRLHISDMVTLGPMPQELKEDSHQWARCASGAEEAEAYIAKLESAGFVEIKMKYDGDPQSQENNMPDLIAVKIVAYKP